MTGEYRKGSLSFSCVLVGSVFFLVLSQALIVKLPDVVTQIFRPLIVFFLLLVMFRRGQEAFPARKVALIAAIYCAFDLLLTSVNVDEITRASAVSLYLLMFWVVTGTPWTKREVQFIIKACFLASFACAIAIFISNDPTDLSVGNSGDMSMFGTYVNRNKNAYAFTIGTVIGVIYLIYGKHVKKFWVLVITAVVAYALLYSQCRGAFFCTVVGVAIVVFGKLLEVKKRDQGKFLLYSFLFILFCIASYYLLKNSELSRLIDGDKSGRDDGIKHAWQLFLSSDMFGKIFGNGYVYEGAHTEGVGAHLVYTSYLLSTGMVGCLLIVWMFICSGLRIKGTIPLALFICAFMRTFFEGLDYYIYIPLILSMIIYNYSVIYGRKEDELFESK